MVTVLITGGTGMIGKALTTALVEKGYAVIILSRNPGGADLKHPSVSYAAWNIEKQTIDIDAIATADYIVHLAGASLAEKRWTEQRKKEIVDSRIKSSALLVKALRQYPNSVRGFISTSATGWYAADPSIPNSRPFTEDDPSASDFLGTTCAQWEESVQPIMQPGKRLVILRVGIVLSMQGGALKEFSKPLKWGIAPIMGNGKQIMSWIHIDDVVKLYITAIENETMQGVYNTVAPSPVSNKELVLRLANCSGKRFYVPFPVPAFLLKLLFGKLGNEVLKSATVSSQKTEATGFSFTYPRLEEALMNLTAT
jgi:uncharacterized protein (TIGR01777 family)